MHTHAHYQGVGGARGLGPCEQDRERVWAWEVNGTGEGHKRWMGKRRGMGCRWEGEEAQCHTVMGGAGGQSAFEWEREGAWEVNGRFGGLSYINTPIGFYTFAKRSVKRLVNYREEWLQQRHRGGRTKDGRGRGLMSWEQEGIDEKGSDDYFWMETTK